MAKIVKEQTAEASLVITETFTDEAAALDKDVEPEKTDVKVIDLRIDHTKWRKEFDE